MKTFIFLIFIFPIITINGQFSDTKSIAYSLKDGIFDLGDFDNDGDLDVIFGCNDYNRTLVWYENTDGIGDNWIPHAIVENELGNSIQNVKTVDIDDDGDLDFLASGYRTKKLYLFRNNSTPTEVVFGKEIIKENFEIDFLDISDFDNDPNTIEVVAGSGNTLLRFSFDLNQGTIAEDAFDIGTFYIQTSNFDPQPELQIIDLDNDGDNDFLVGQSWGPYDLGGLEKYWDISYGWLENTGNLDFSTYHSIESLFAISETDLGCYGDCHPRIIAGNFNNDNLPDIICYTADYIEYGLKFLPQNPDHTFAEGEFIVNYSSNTNLLPHDVDQDGDLDFYTSAGWYSNNGNETFELNLINDAQPIVKIGDVENDGDQDLFALQYSYSSPGGLSILKNEGAATFSSPNFISDNVSGLSRAYPNDFDGDGDEDLMILAFGEGNIYWAENEQGDSVTNPKMLIDDGDIQFAIPPVDIDNDGDKDIVAYSSSYELIWFDALDATPSFSDRILIDPDISTTASVSSISSGDINGDGNIDILTHGYQHMQIHSNLGNGNFAAPVILQPTDFWYPLGITDSNSDGIPDILFRKYSDPNIWAAVQDASGNFTDVVITNLVDQTFGSILLDDLDDDGDKDIITVIKDNGCSSACSKIVAYFQDGSTFTKEHLVDSDDNYIRGIADLDGDGRKDIYSDERWYRQLYSPNIFSSSLIHIGYNFSTGIVIGHADLDNDNDIDLYFKRYFNGLVWIENQINTGYWISGNIFLDENQNCINDGIDTLVDLQLIVSLESNNVTYSTSTNEQGFYNILVLDTGTYNISITTPSSYWESCINNSTVQVDSNQTILDIPIFNAIDCPLLGMHVGGSPLRPCIDGIVGLWYYNNGTTTAENVQVEVVVDDNLIINNISPMWTSMTDSSFIFDIGELDFNEDGSLYFYVTPDCDSVTFGDLVCVNAYITPDTICTDSLWDGSVINAIGGCEGDSVYFLLENIGTGDMMTSRDYSINIVNDDIVMLIFLDTFQLGAGETKMIALPSQGAVMQLVAEQDPNLPNGDDVSLLITDCAGLPTNEVQHLILNFPDNDGDPFTEKYCRVLTGSYDPNSKEAIPLGVGEEKFIDRDWEIDYTINFQNVGNDTAFTVVVVDTLTEYLDLSTLRVGGGSHPFTWQLESDRRLVFTFNNILLPDSLTNEIRSQGLVNFSIKPIPDIAFGTTINNKAAIYFDFNEPVITDSITRTILTPVFASSTHLELCEGDDSFGFPITSDTLVIDSLMMSDGLHLSFQHLDMVDILYTEIDTSIFLGETFLGFPINQDTTIETSHQSANNCDSIVIYNVSTMTVSNHNNTLTNNFKVFPNPTNDVFFITWKGSDYPPTDIEIYNVQGLLFQKYSRETLSSSTSTQQIKIDANNWSSGLYTLKIETSLGNTYQKLIIFE